MELINVEEVHLIVKPFGSPKILNWSIENYADELIGYLGDHLRLRIQVESESGESELKLFVKCMPRFDQWKAQYLKELNFFKSEYIMLSDLFQHFKPCNGLDKWRPRLLYIREDLFVFEDLAELGYKMPCQRFTLSYDEIMATVKAVAKFHAQSIIFEEKKSKQLNRDYTIWEDYKEYLQEPPQGQDWRDTGRNAVIDYLKVFSSHRHKPNFAKSLEVVIPMLFEGALTQMKPSSLYRNVVIHRDLWTNNILFKKLDNGKIHALIVDFQTVLYASPILDISSILFFHTTRSFRNAYTTDVLEYYYDVLSNELKAEEIDIDTVFDKATLDKAYEDSIMFGITQAAIITPLVVMDSAKREELFSNPEKVAYVNTVSRSAEFIQIAKEDENYETRVTELFDEIVDRYVFPNKNN